MKRLFFIAAIVVIAGNVQGQKIGDLSFGVKAGLNLPSTTLKNGSAKVKGKMIPGIHIGGFAEAALTENIFLQPELMFSTFGAKQPGSETKIVLSYLTLPLLGKYKYEDFGFLTGPQIGFLASAKAKYEGNSASYKDYVKSLDFSWILGAEYFLESGLGFNVRYALGIMNIAKGNNYKENHNVLQLGALYRF